MAIGTQSKISLAYLNVTIVLKYSYPIRIDNVYSFPYCMTQLCQFLVVSPALSHLEPPPRRTSARILRFDSRGKNCIYRNKIWVTMTSATLWRLR
jgi:hypothetical protein